MTEEDRQKCENAVAFFLKQHDDNPDCSHNSDKCFCSLAQAIRGIVEWWKRKKAAE